METSLAIPQFVYFRAVKEPCSWASSCHQRSERRPAKTCPAFLPVIASSISYSHTFPSAVDCSRPLFRLSCRDTTPPRRYTFSSERRAVMHPNQPPATWGNGPIAGDAAPGHNNEISGGNGTATAGANGGGGGGGSKRINNSTARSRAWKARAGKAESEADAASLVRTLALSNFGNRPVFLEVRRGAAPCVVATFQHPRGAARARRTPLKNSRKSLFVGCHKAPR